MLSSVKGAYWISSNSSFIQYCDSNIGLFSFSPISYRSSNFAIAKLSLLKAIAKSKDKIILLALEGDSDMCTFTLR